MELAPWPWTAAGGKQEPGKAQMRKQLRTRDVHDWNAITLGQLMFSRRVVQSLRLPGFPAFLCLLEFAQTHVHWVGDAIQPPHPMSPLSPPGLNLSQHQDFSRVYLSKNYISSFTVILAVFQIQYQVLENFLKFQKTDMPWNNSSKMRQIGFS